MAVTEVAGIGHGVGFKPVKDDNEDDSGIFDDFSKRVPPAELSFTTPIKISDEDDDGFSAPIGTPIGNAERGLPPPGTFTILPSVADQRAAGDTTIVVPAGMHVAQHHSAGKPKFGLVPPRALLDMAKVMSDAEAKYPPQGHTPNYLIGNGFDPRDYIESALRHLNACVRGEQLNDTGMHHLAHAAIDAAIALELMYHRGDHK